MEIASTEQDFEVTIKAAGKLMFRQKQKVTTFVGGNVNQPHS
jgi:hypothetical protein